MLLVDEDWKIQSLTTDLKPQIMLAGTGMTIALFVLAAVATAAPDQTAKRMPSLPTRAPKRGPSGDRLGGIR